MKKSASSEDQKQPRALYRCLLSAYLHTYSQNEQGRSAARRVRINSFECARTRKKAHTTLIGRKKKRWWHCGREILWSARVCSENENWVNFWRGAWEAPLAIERGRERNKIYWKALDTRALEEYFLSSRALWSSVIEHTASVCFCLLKVRPPGERKSDGLEKLKLYFRNTELVYFRTPLRTDIRARFILGEHGRIYIK